MRIEADALKLDDQIISDSSRAYLDALVRSYNLTNAAFVIHTLPGRPPNLPIIWTTNPQDQLLNYLKRNHASIASMIATEQPSVLPIDLDIKFKAYAAPPDITDTAGSLHALMVPVRGPLGERSFLLVSCRLCDVDWPAKRRALVPTLLLIAQYIHHQSMSTAGIYKPRHDKVKLAPREAECLHWAASGKTVEDIATILNISRRVTRGYLDGARVKLNASNIAHAVARAITLGLVAAG
jgi:DNA-binding CsgD family transcriptional regulator